MYPRNFVESDLARLEGTYVMRIACAALNGEVNTKLTWLTEDTIEVQSYDAWCPTDTTVYKV